MSTQVKYKVVPSAFSNNDNKQYHASVEAYKSLDLEDIIEEMEFRHSSLTTSDMAAMFVDFGRTVIKRIKEGDRVSTDLFQISLSIKGKFNSLDDAFDKKRHKVRICINPSRAFTKAVTQDVQVEKKVTEQPMPKLMWFFNLEGSAPNTELTPTHMARIKGENLTFDQSDPQQGVFLVPVNSPDPDNDAIRMTHFSRKTSGQIVFRVPEGLTPGFYQLEVRALFGASNLRTGTYKEKLEVK
ncbi:MAG: DUF4469 domain-containing protein [Anaerolineae bacterium]|nr:DUF4469 domain-containing protein [Anaerolineae bacterium]